MIAALPPRASARLAIVSAMFLLVAACGASSPSNPSCLDATAAARSGPWPTGSGPEAALVASAAAAAMTTYNLKALIVRVTRDGKDLYTGALGESLTGVPATPAMHYRNGAYLPSDKLAISVVTTYTPAGFDDLGNYTNASERVFREIAAALGHPAPPKN